MNRQRHRKRWKSFAAHIGDPIYSLLAATGLWARGGGGYYPGFFRSYWSAEVSVPSARKKDDFVLICLGR